MIWCSFGCSEHGQTTWFPFGGLHAGQSCLFFYWKSCSYIPFPVLADLWQLPRGSWRHPGSTQRARTLFAETTAFWRFRSCLRAAHRAFVQLAYRPLKNRRCLVTELWLAVWLRRWRRTPARLHDVQLSFSTCRQNIINIKWLRRTPCTCSKG